MVQMIKLRISKTEIAFTYGFFCSVMLLILTDRTGMFLLSYIAVILHEIGHFGALCIFGAKITAVRFTLSGVKIVKSKILSKNATVAVALSGPLVNLSLFSFYLCENAYIKYFAVANLVIGVFNLLPISGLDGGDIISGLLYTKRNGYAIINAVSVITLSAILGVGIVLVLNRYANLTLLVCSVYLFILSILSFFKF